MSAPRLFAGWLLLTLAPASSRALSIRNTKHDLSASSTTTGPKATTEGQLCIFCHTPHKPNPSVPLWNKTQTAQTFTLYSSNYLNTYLAYPAQAPTQMTGTVSRMCMSCHDGVTAIGGVFDFNGSPGTIPVTGAMSAAATLGTNLGDDHPVMYPVLPGAGPGQDPELTLPPIGDAVKLYDAVTHRPLATPVAGALVECGSCHNPHDNQYGKFLVKANAGAAICTTCHTKTGFAASIHRTSAVAYTPPGEAATTVGSWACRDCHRMHGANAAVSNQKYQLRGAEEATCFACHNGTLAGAKNIQGLMQAPKVSFHPTVATSNRHADPELTGASFTVANRHAECQDCHDQHQLQSGNRLAKASPSNLISNVLIGAWGVIPTYGAVAWTAPTGYTRQVLLSTATDKEYYLCFKCHSSYAYGGTPPVGYTDQSIEFNPANYSKHPVITPGTNAYCTSTATNGNRVTMVAPWNDTPGEHNTMMCSDCHGSDNAAEPEGPHGSAQVSILQASLVATNTNTWGRYATPLCLKCHNGAVYANNNGLTLGSRYAHQANGGMFRGPTDAGSNGYGGCLACHGNLTAGVKGTFHGEHSTWAAGPANQFLCNTTNWTNWNEAGKTCTTITCHTHNGQGY